MITNTFTALCPECASAPFLKPDQSQVRQICLVDGVSDKRGRRKIFRACQHIVVDETFDIENEPQDQESMSPS